MTSVAPPSARTNLAIVTIATGNYHEMYFEAFEESVRNTFAPGYDLTIYCFTDKQKPTRSQSKYIETRHLGWPFATLLRFHLMGSIMEELMAYDFVLYMDADMKAVGAANPKLFAADLVAVEHPGFYRKPTLATFEIHETQGAFVAEDARRIYVQGCFWGGKSSSVKELVQTIVRKIDADLVRAQIPVWHDESYLNWYLADRHFTVVPSSYAFPETSTVDLKPVVIHMAKQHDAVRDTHLHAPSPERIIAGLSQAEQTALYRSLYLASHIKTQDLEIRLLRRDNGFARRLRFAFRRLFGLRCSRL